MYASDSPSPLVKFELNEDMDTDLPPMGTTNLKDESQATKSEASAVIKKPHKFIYPRLNFFGSGSSNVVADSSSHALPSQLSPARSVVNSQLKNDGSKSKSISKISV